MKLPSNPGNITNMYRLLIVSHTPSPNTRKLTEAVVRGASDNAISDVNVQHKRPLEASADDVMGTQAIILGTTENFGYMSGALKDFFDRIYYPCLEKTQALPYCLFVKAGNDGLGAVASVERIAKGLKWRAVQQPLICCGPFNDTFEVQCEELGMTMAAGLEAGIF
jgi:multimeric flavodoxin WrbA